MLTCTARYYFPTRINGRLTDEGRAMGLPTDPTVRKSLPIWTGVIQYFPDVWAEIAKVSQVGNDQHNPGEPLHWARDKSVDQMNTAFRHLLDYAAGQRLDTDGTLHLAKAIWRLCAECQVDIERAATPSPVVTSLSAGEWVRGLIPQAVADLDLEIPF